MSYEVCRVNMYRITCQANWPASDRGCSCSGPRAFTPEKAAVLALEKGWDLIAGRWVCPAHLEAIEETE